MMGRKPYMHSSMLKMWNSEFLSCSMIVIAKYIHSQMLQSPSQAQKCKQPIYCTPFTPINLFCFSLSIFVGGGCSVHFCLTAAKSEDRWNTAELSFYLASKQSYILKVRAGRPKRHDEKRAQRLNT